MSARRSARRILALAAGSALSWCAPAFAGITTDGSLGAARNFTGSTVNLPASLGRQKGGNVFHSFSQFDIAPGQSATFTADGATASVKNVLARVTGGRASQINGELGCNIPGANLYLINPAGLTFGKGSSLNVNGTFTVTTADVVRMANRQQFVVARNGNSVLTGSTPAAFGFLSRKPTGIHIIAADLQAPGIEVIGGEIKVEQSDLISHFGRVSLIGEKSGYVTVNSEHGDRILVGDSQRGPIDFDASQIDTTGIGGGRVDLIGSDMEMNGSITSGNEGIARQGEGKNSRAISADLSGSLMLNGTISTLSGFVNSGGSAGAVALRARAITMKGSISSNTMGLGSAGPITIETRDLLIDGSNSTISPAGLSAQAVFPDVNSSRGKTGDAANITIHADKFAMRGLARIDSETESDARGGNISVYATSMSLADGAKVTSSSLSDGPAGAIDVRASRLSISGDFVLLPSTPEGGNHADSATKSSAVDRQFNEPTTISSTAMGFDPTYRGEAGKVNIVADEFSLVGNSKITTDTQDKGSAGKVAIQCHRLFMAGGSSITSSTFRRGDGGEVSIIAGRLSLEASGESGDTLISTNAQHRSLGAAGDVVVRASRSLAIDDGGTISSETSGNGDAGAVTIRAGQLTVRANGRIDSDTFSAANAGKVTVQANEIALNGSGSMTRPAAISSNTNSDGGGRAGIIAIKCRDIQIVGGGQITSATAGSGSAGSVTIVADSAMIDGGDSNLFTGINSQAGPASTGKAGDVNVSADNLSVLRGAAIDSRNAGHGTGGSVELQGQRLFLGQGTSVAASSQESAAGDVRIHMDDSVDCVGGAGVDRATITASSLKGAGGNVVIDANKVISFNYTDVTAQAATTGLQLRIDPLVVVLNHTNINGLAGDKRTPVKLSINPSAILIKSPDSSIFNDNPVLPPNVDLTGAILHFVVPTIGQQSVLAEGCEAQFRHRNLSSFTAHERLGIPPAPGAAVLSAPAASAGGRPVPVR